MSIKVEQTPDYVVVSIENKRLDAAFAPQLREKMQELASQGLYTIILDLSAVEFVDSSGLGAIVAAFKLHQPRGDFLICGCRAAVVQLFRLTHMDSVFVLHPDLDSAIRALRA